jgi:Carboxypeptidase regulatory-like domain/TonB dependent receptor
MSPLFVVRQTDSIFPASILLLAVFLVGAPPAVAQKDTGAIVGTVHDASGAVVVGAKVSVTDFERGQTFTTTTNSSGEYVASPLRIGRYTVTIEHPGFKTAASNVVEINVQDRAAVNITLQVGSAMDRIEVEATTPLIQTETSELGQVVDSRRVSTLPLNGRNFAQLALLSAGTAPSEPGARDEGGYGFSSNGARSLQNNFLLDGVDNNSNLPDLLNETNFVIQPPIDALEEFKVQTNAYSAEFGRGNGAIVNAVIKSGKNQLHGSLWEFLRNEKLDSRNYFDDRSAPTPPYKRNQFGGTIGGPVVIPGLYNGKDRTFFSFDYEGLRVRQAQTQTGLVPNTAWLGGDFTNNLDGSTLLDYASPTHQNPDGTGPLIQDCNGVQTYNGELFDTRQTQSSGSSPTGLCGVPFGYNGSGQPVNVIPSHLFDPLALRLAALYPAAGTIKNGNNFLANPVLAESRTNFDTRVDEKFSDADSVFFRFSYEDQPSTIPGTFGGIADGGGFFSGVEENSYRSFATSWTRIFKPTLINEFRLGYNRINSQRAQLNANKDISGDPAFSVNFPGVPFSAGIGGLPQLTFNDVATLGSPTFLPSKELQNSYTLSENLTWVKGHHVFKYGTEIRREEFTIYQPASPRGNLDFSAGFTDNPAAPGSGGTGFASFLVGLTDGGSINNLHNIDYFRQTYAFYGQDDWKITDKLTLNLGLRYELFLPVTERHNQLATFDLSHPLTPTLIVPRGDTLQLTPTIATQVATSPTGSKSLIAADWNNFAPRIGFAFQIAPKSVLRAGYGIFYGGQENGPYSNPSPGFNPPFFVTQSFAGPCGAASANPALFNSDPNLNNDCAVPDVSNQPSQIPGSAGLFVGFPATALTDPNTPIFFSVDQNLRTPYMQQWHLGVQQELPGKSSLELTYAGSKGTKLYTFFNGNQARPDPDPTSPTAPRRPVPSIDAGIDWFRSTGKSSYHSLQAHYEKRFQRGLQFQASYTWAHSLDISSNANLGPTQNNSDFRDFRFPGAEYGNSDFDVRHRFVFSSIYELPFGRGKKFLGNASGITNKITGGWQMSNIVSITTGNWYTVLDENGNFANADSNAGGASQRPDQIGDPRAKPCVPGTYFNTCAFGDPAPGSFGNVGRNTIQGPGNKDWDFSIFKTFSFEEKAHLEFRAEFFNILNHTNFLFAKSGPQNGNGSTILGASQFGFLTAARDPRQIQLALKLSF